MTPLGWGVGWGPSASWLPTLGGFSTVSADLAPGNSWPAHDSQEGAHSLPGQPFWAFSTILGVLCGCEDLKRP